MGFKGFNKCRRTENPIQESKVRLQNIQRSEPMYDSMKILPKRLNEEVAVKYIIKFRSIGIFHPWTVGENIYFFTLRLFSMLNGFNWLPRRYKFFKDRLSFRQERCSVWWRTKQYYLCTCAHVYGCTWLYVHTCWYVYVPMCICVYVREDRTKDGKVIDGAEPYILSWETCMELIHGYGARFVFPLNCCTY